MVGHRLQQLHANYRKLLGVELPGTVGLRGLEQAPRLFSITDLVIADAGVFWSGLVNAPAEDPHLNGELLLGVPEGSPLVIDPAALNLPAHGHALQDGIGPLPAMLGASFTNLTTLGSPVLKTESLSDHTACVLITSVGQINLAILIFGLWASRGNGANRSTLLTPRRLNTSGAQERCTHPDEAPQAMISISVAVRNRALALLWLGLIPTPMIQAALAAPQMTAPSAQRRPAQNQGTEQLERSWQRLDAELRTLDRLLPGEPEPPVRGVLSTPELPAGSGVENAGVVGAEQHDLALHLGGHGPAQGPHHQHPADSRQAQSYLVVIAQAGPSLLERRG